MDRHDSDRRDACSGVTPADLDADKQIWSDIGAAIAVIARRLAEGCRASSFCANHPAAAVLCARLVEAIDDQVDVPAWLLIEAAASAAVERR